MGGRKGTTPSMSPLFRSHTSFQCLYFYFLFSSLGFSAILLLSPTPFSPCYGFDLKRLKRFTYCQTVLYWKAVKPFGDEA
jgi:hypothetical protein